MFVIVTTTINPPTEALYKYIDFVEKAKNRTMIIVGDKKTPHDDYLKLVTKNESKFHSNLCTSGRVEYLTPDIQEKQFPEVSEILGWNNIQRRNIGFLWAMKYYPNFDILATVDDDNIPQELWGEISHIGESDLVTNYKQTFGGGNEALVMDPLSVTKENHLWHRGFPIQLIENKNNNIYKSLKKEPVKPDIEAYLWNGAPDIDAICRIQNPGNYKFDGVEAFTMSSMSPFNSQNTLMNKRALQNYACLPFIGRMDDIWGSYLCQSLTNATVVYREPNVYQQRNTHDNFTDMKAEMLGYEHTLDFIRTLHHEGAAGGAWKTYVPDDTVKFWDAYQRQINSIFSTT